MGGALFLIAVAIIGGIVLGIKTSLWFQILIPILTAVAMKKSDGQGIGAEAFLAFFMLFTCFGVVIGDLIYYFNYHNSSGMTIGKAILWLFQP